MRSSIRAVAILVWITSFATTFAENQCDAAEPQWRAGVAQACITPEGSYWMAGYASRDRPSEGTLEDLYAKAIAIDDAAGARIVIVTMDLIVIPKDFAEAVYQRVEEEYGLPKSRILLNCSHTHTGPEVRPTREEIYSIPGIYVKKIREYTKRLEDQLVEIIGAAIEDQRPADLTVSESAATFAVNRRNNREADVPALREAKKLTGPVDHAVPVMRVTDADGKIIAILFGYACHNTVLSLNETSGDYAGVAQKSIEKKYPGAQAMFVMGAGGDQNPLPRRELKYVYEHGESLAAAVEQALAGPQRSLDGPLHVARGEADVQFQPHEDRSTLEELAKSDNRYQRWKANFVLGELDAGRELSRDYEVPIQVIAFGDDLLMVAIGGETVVDYALRVKQDFAEENGPLLWVAGYSNEVFGYLPSLRVLREGGYEGGGAMMYTEFPGPFTESVEQRVFEMIHRLIDAVRHSEDAAAAVEKEARPNILIITADNLGYGDLPSYNPKSSIKTPHLDRLAAQGARLTNFYTASPTCTVSRACLLTGRIPQRHGLLDQLAGVEGNYGVGLASREILIPQILKKASTPYTTGCFGKWNIGFAEGSRPTERGFDEFIGHASGNIDYYHHHYRQEHDLYEGTSKLYMEGEYSTDIFADAAVDFIGRRSKSPQPWFCYLPFNAPHFPSAGNKKPGQANVWQAPDWALEAYGLSPDESDPEKRYGAVVTAMDEAIGRVLRALDESGEADRTFVFFMSDNGAFRLDREGLDVGSNDPLRGGGVTCWEGGLRVVALARWPKRIPAGAVIDQPLWSPDVLVACTALADATLPRDRVYDGKNPLRVLTGEEVSPHQSLFFRYRSHAALRQGDWKIVREKPAAAWQLFDLDRDPAEAVDLASEQPGRIAELTAAFSAWEESF